MKEKIVLFWLLSKEYLGFSAIQKLIKANGSVRAVWKGDYSCLNEMQRESLKKDGARYNEIAEKFEKMLESGISLVTGDEAEFPKSLLNISNPPMALFMAGKVIDEEKPAVGMVGARAATSHGSAFAENLAYEISSFGITVVSGMALGIDGACHKGALSGQGGTIGVLGCGIDVVYPAYHARLFEEIKEKGTLISEYAPGMRGLPHHFIARNRLISGMSDAVIVVEAKKKSGSLITAEYALNQGRDVMAVPGRPSDSQSEGTNRLIKEGAACCTCVQDVLDILKIPLKVQEKTQKAIALCKEAGQIYKLLKEGTIHPDALSVKSKIPVERVLQLLLSLELDGFVKLLDSGSYEVCSR